MTRVLQKGALSRETLLTEVRDLVVRPPASGARSWCRDGTAAAEVRAGAA